MAQFRKITNFQFICVVLGNIHLCKLPRTPSSGKRQQKRWKLENIENVYIVIQMLAFALRKGKHKINNFQTVANFGATMNF
ncbi:hypothetical protein X975_08622, partial [Stegodyphus mimosarum]